MPQRPTGLVPQPHRGQARSLDLRIDDSEPGPGQWSSNQLLGNRKEIEILHSGSVYRLRVTSLGKLILTK